ncbi:DPOA [Enterospora canceri]|uniref:DNA polymerase n=1 Tax=Enterospora canceri TaxID=1081671 RepID=A0A1Y1S982_9MICR|nr:DPOA [Enterospora canceri]
MIFQIYNYDLRNESEVFLYGKSYDETENRQMVLVVNGLISDVYFLPARESETVLEDELMAEEGENISSQILLKKELLAQYANSISKIELVERKNIFHKNFDKYLKMFKVSFTKKINLDKFESDYCDFVLTEFSNPIEQLIVSKKLMGCALIEFDESDVIEKKKIRFIHVDKINFVKAAKFKRLATCTVMVGLENSKIAKYCVYDGKTSTIGTLNNDKNEEEKGLTIRYFDNENAVENDLIALLKSKEYDFVITHNFNLRRLALHKRTLMCDIFTFAQGTTKCKDYSIKELSEKYSIKCEEEFHSDTKSVHQLHEKMNILNLAREMSEISGYPINKCFSNSRAGRIEYTMLHNLYERGFLFPLNTKSGETQDYTGGLVLEPEKGFYTNIILLLDFNSLYPSIVQEFNVCFSSIDELEAGKPVDENLLFLPRILNQLVKRRAEVKKQIKTCKTAEKLLQFDTRQKVLKLTANSIYGCLGFSNSRFCNYKMAAFITKMGRTTLEDTKRVAEKMNMKVIYGDTDSIMIHTKYPGIREYHSKAKESVAEFAKAINQKYKHVVIELECCFAKMIIYSKKKYAGLIFDMKGHRIETKGLEIVRRDFCEASGDLFMDILKIVFDEKSLDLVEPKMNEVNAQAIYDQSLHFYKTMENRPISDFVISIVLGKELEHYGNKSSLLHIQLGLRLKTKGMKYRPGDVINYVMGETKEGKTIPFEPKEAFKMDYGWYITNQILPPLYRLLSPIKNIHMEKIGLIFNTKDVHIPREGARELVFYSQCCENQVDLNEKKCLKCKKSVDQRWIEQKILNLLRSNNNHCNSKGTCLDCGRTFTNALTVCCYCKKSLLFDFKNKEFDDILRNVETAIKNTDLMIRKSVTKFSEHSKYRKVDFMKYFRREIERYERCGIQ